MEAVCHVGDDAVQRLHTLGLEPDDICVPLGRASAEARLSTELDSPGMAGYTFWSRCNRFFREQMQDDGWTYSNSQQILRCIHPSGRFAITAVSASGNVGEEGASWSGDIRTKNPKGPAVARLVQRNGEQLALFHVPGQRVETPDINEIPTWFLLYKSSKEGLAFELSMPVDMHGKYVDTWRERIVLDENPFRGPEFDIKRLDEAVEDVTVDVPVEFKGAI
ncbi:hypothetical protein GCM10009548_11770 [Streptomyces malaysiensis subsp. malaysiensis]|uniref:Uncharacterized protein n=1 Tax=Streptomyces malaysiensis TaxID=92644 RepID=A0ABX6W9T6_STRMQ|nr:MULTISPECIES: hypothetical protein [Streptomyces]QPI57365.1 hypothetical protein I1A49_22825 [Streptomyces solisilvae]UHH18917.1 hypothetical protein LUV23_23010 [Streptomyces sp. HNM0561]